MGIVTRDFSFQLGQLGRHLFVRGDHLTQSHEGPHYKDAHLDSTGAVEHVCRHDRPVLGEGIGRETGVAVPLGTGRNLGLGQFILLKVLPLQVISGLSRMRAVAHKSNDLGLEAARLRRSMSRMIPPMDSTAFVVVGRPSVG